MDPVIAATLDRPVPPEIGAMADHVRQQHGDVKAVLAYGSCLRGVATTESLIDLYVLTGSYEGVSSNAFSRWGCRLVPPNIYYAECDFAGLRYRAKYAVLPLTAFARRMTAANPYFWARFSQPAALVFSADAMSRKAVISALARAARTMYAHALALPHEDSGTSGVWIAGFRATYATELRAEAGGSRAAHVVEANAAYYKDLARILHSTAPEPANWRWKRIAGKLWAAARLIKASFTFTGGADYIVWKIERHSGQKIVLTGWQRRHPVIAGLMLLPQLIRRGAVR